MNGMIHVWIDTCTTRLDQSLLMGIETQHLHKYSLFCSWIDRVFLSVSNMTEIWIWNANPWHCVLVTMHSSRNNVLYGISKMCCRFYYWPRRVVQVKKKLVCINKLWPILCFFFFLLRGSVLNNWVRVRDFGSFRG